MEARRLPIAGDKSGDLTKSILRKWEQQGGFIRFVNQDTLDLRRQNLEHVSMKDAMDHVDDWKVDWDMNLTEEEIALVRNPTWRAGLTL
jgi:hypothetical protein